MPKTKISEYSATANSNTDVASINIDEGCAPSGINNAIRAVMGHLKDFQTGASGDPVTVGGVLTVTGGSASAPAITTSGDTNTGIVFPAADTVAVATGGTERARVDSSGNLGLGVTPSTKLDIGSGTLRIKNATGDTSGLLIYQDTGDSSTFKNYYTGPFKWIQGSTQAMTLDASGNLLVGATSQLGSERLLVSRATGTAIMTIQAQASGTAGASMFMLGATTAKNWAVGSSYNYAGALEFTPSTANGGSTFSTPAMMLDSSGNLLVGTTTTSYSNTNSFAFDKTQGYTLQNHISGSSSGSVYTYFAYNASQVGSITQSGTTGVLYNVTSDYRLKTVIGAVTGSGERIDALEPIEYQWKSDGSNTRGFLAHRFQEVYPQSVSGEKDAVDEEGNPKYQTMQSSTSEVMADLVAEIQSLRKRLTALENK